MARTAFTLSLLAISGGMALINAGPTGNADSYTIAPLSVVVSSRRR